MFEKKVKDLVHYEGKGKAGDDCAPLLTSTGPICRRFPGTWGKSPHCSSGGYGKNVL